jgi:flagellar basal body L-ring protein FlgH
MPATETKRTHEESQIHEEFKQLYANNNDESQSQIATKVGDIVRVEVNLSDYINKNEIYETNTDLLSDNNEELNLEFTKVRIPAVILNILPNERVFVSGTQDIEINSKKKKVTIQGIVEADDIAANNIVESSQIKEFKLTYN